jgi:DNA repair protein RadA/Sms
MTNLRMLRASKNRFGSSDEVGVYEMTQGRLLPVSDPSSLFLAHRNDQDDAEGCAIAVRFFYASPFHR